VYDYFKPALTLSCTGPLVLLFLNESDVMLCICIYTVGHKNVPHFVHIFASYWSILLATVILSTCLSIMTQYRLKLRWD